MTRYIDADALIESMTKFSNAIGEDMTHGIFYAHIAPTIDAVPVIRCRDCKYLRFTGTVWKCQNSIVMMLCEPNDYCSRAERRGEGWKK